MFIYVISKKARLQKSIQIVLVGAQQSPYKFGDSQHLIYAKLRGRNLLKHQANLTGTSRGNDNNTAYNHH